MSTEHIEPPQLYASREAIYPRDVHGTFRRLKSTILWIALAVYYVLPWVRWDRGEGMPDQAVLVDLANRRFFMFWLEIWPHEFYFVAGLLIMAGLGLFLATSALGRVWCGYACPQTVWTDLYLKVERIIQGDRNARIRLHEQPWNGRKLRLKLTTWAIWLAIAVATGATWVFYFTDAPTILQKMLTGQAAYVAYATVGVLTFTTFAFAGFAREQICIYACPWPRIQGAMMDENTLTVAYREWRGEPRGKIGKGELTKSEGGAKGDCIDCLACVNVCPMGIDIRDGQQLECITCALCIDACDEIMDKIGKPRGLIDYMALKDEAAEKTGSSDPRPLLKHILRPRTLLYFVLWSGIGIGLVVAMFMRSPFDLNVSPVRNPVYVALADGTIRNTYEVRMRNKLPRETEFSFGVVAPEGIAEDTFSLRVEGSDNHMITVAPDETASIRVYLDAAPGSALAKLDTADIVMWAEDVDKTARADVDTVFHGRP